MELDLRFKQYELKQEDLNSVQEIGETENRVVKPYQEVIDYLEEHKTDFYYKDFASKFKNIQGMINIVLSDGSKVILGSRAGITNLAIFYADGTKFVGTWSNIKDDKEFQEKCRNLS